MVTGSPRPTPQVLACLNSLRGGAFLDCDGHKNPGAGLTEMQIQWVCPGFQHSDFLPASSDVGAATLEWKVPGEFCKGSCSFSVGHAYHARACVSSQRLAAHHLLPEPIFPG